MGDQQGILPNGTSIGFQADIKMTVLKTCHATRETFHGAPLRSLCKSLSVFPEHVRPLNKTASFLNDALLTMLDSSH